MNSPPRQVEVITQRERAELLMHPLRVRILEAARKPGSGADLARRLGEKPQTVNYHIKRLADHGFLRTVDERRAGNVVETVWGTRADSYVLASDLLGGLSPRPEATTAATAGRWLSLQSRAEAELDAVVRQAERDDGSVGAFSVDAEFRFETEQQRELFARTVEELFRAVVSKYTSPPSTAGTEPAPGRPYRMLLGCYPVPEPDSGSLEIPESSGSSED